MKNVTARKDELLKCVNCGLCQSVCPTYLLERHEALTARGKIVLLKGILDRIIEPSASIADLFDNCLTCYACQSVCPAGVKTERLWTAARQDLAKWSKVGKVKRVGIQWSVGKPILFNFEAMVGGKLWGTPLSSSAPYISQLQSEYLPDVEPVASVGLLLGCSGNVFVPSVIDSTIKLLIAGGYRIVIPKRQVCCGAPAINNGDWDTARKLALMNANAFTELNADYVTSPDATCAGAMTCDYHEIFAELPNRIELVERLSDMVIGLDQLLYNVVERLHFHPIETEVTLHDSCHSTHIGNGDRWRDILSSIDKLQLNEMHNSDHCCGFGGSYMFTHRKLSKEIAQTKIGNAKDTDSKQMLVGSPGCMVRLQSANDGNGFQVRHVTELLMELIEN